MEGVPPSAPLPGSHYDDNSSIAVTSTDIVPVSRRPATFVVQAPKDQVYRIPPPENAYIAERYREKLKSRRKRTAPCLSWLSYILAIALFLTILGLMSALIFFLVVRPGIPSFELEGIVAGHPHKRTEFDITMKTNNPSEKMSYFCEKGGNAVLSHRGMKSAEGEPPAFGIEYRDATTFKLVLHGSKSVLPTAIERSLKGSKDVVPLSLSVNFPVRLGIGALQTWVMKMGVVCDVRVSKLGKGGQIEFQKCETKLPL